MLSTNEEKGVRRIYTEEKGQVVTAAWGTEFIKFLAALTILHHDDLKNGMNSTEDKMKKGEPLTVSMVWYFCWRSSSCCLTSSICSPTSSPYGGTQICLPIILYEFIN